MRQCAACSSPPSSSPPATSRRSSSARRTSPSRCSSARSSRSGWRRPGCKVERKLDLGGTLVCDKAITAGALDVYPEYSGTALTAILHRPQQRDRAAVDATKCGASTRARTALGAGARIREHVRHDRAPRRRAAAALRTISDLRGRGHVPPRLRLRVRRAARRLERPAARTTACSSRSRRGRWTSASPTGRSASGKIDLIAGNSTDGLIESLGLVVARRRSPLLPAVRRGDRLASVHRREMQSGSCRPGVDGRHYRRRGDAPPQLRRRRHRIATSATWPVRCTGSRHGYEEASRQRKDRQHLHRQTAQDPARSRHRAEAKKMPEKKPKSGVQTGARKYPDLPLPKQHHQKPGIESEIEPRPMFETRTIAAAASSRTRSR